LLRQRSACERFGDDPISGKADQVDGVDAAIAVDAKLVLRVRDRCCRHSEPALS
jgi:hypothetical protein